MDIKILDSWLREHVETSAKPADIARCVSLSGPTFDRTHKVMVNGKVDYLYDIEITTNRVDAASVRGIAREVAVILPEFGFKARLIPLKLPKVAAVKNPLPLTIKTSSTLTKRVMGVVLEVDSIPESPKWLSQRLIQSGIRSLNAAVDITNYVMTEIGHPTHVFDYDLVAPQMVIRESKKGEKIISLDNKAYTLPGGDIVIDNGKGEIIDLPGIIGTKNSVVTSSTKRILFFLETNDPVRIRRTSMTLGIRTVAATLNEKGVDPEGAETALLRGIELFKDLLKAKVVSNVHDTYYKKEKVQTVDIAHSFIEDRLGVTVPQTRVVKILTSLGCKVVVNKKRSMYTVTPASYRAKDITIGEDIVEEVARIYGYHNLPSILMSGIIPDPLSDSPFAFEMAIKRTLKEAGGNEIYTYSLIADETGKSHELKLKNPLGSDYSLLRTSLKKSLIAAADDNARNLEPFHLFEVSNVYHARKNNLPDEIVMVAGIVARSDFRHAKGIVETLLDSLHISYSQHPVLLEGFVSDQSIRFDAKTKPLGKFGKLSQKNYYYYEFSVTALQSVAKKVKQFVPIPKYPPQIEDITCQISNDTSIAEVIQTIKEADTRIAQVELTDVYETNFTFRVWYQDETKTLTDSEVSKIHSQIASVLKEKLSVKISS